MRLITDVHRDETAADAVEDHVQPVATRQHGVDERLGQVEAAPAALEHPLDEVTDLLRVEDQGCQLVPAATGHEDAAGVVDPELSPAC